PGVGEQREGAGEQPGHELDDEESGDEHDGDEQPPAVCGAGVADGAAMGMAHEATSSDVGDADAAGAGPGPSAVPSGSGAAAPGGAERSGCCSSLCSAWLRATSSSIWTCGSSRR